MLNGVYCRRLLAVYLLNVAVLAINVFIWSYQPQQQQRDGEMDTTGNRPAPPGVVPDHELEIRRWKSAVRGKRAEEIAPAGKPPIPDAMAYVAKSKLQLGSSGWKPRSGYIDYNSYRVPEIERTSLVNCAAVLSGSETELLKANQTMTTRPKVPVYEETYLDWTTDCVKFRRQRGYVEAPLSAEEESFPLAFSISMYTDVEQAERLLRAVYQPQNLYCIHVDTKTSLLIHRTMTAIANCFDNVWIASHLDKIKWGDVSVLLPEINCMRDLLRFYRHKFRYFINLTGQEFPLRTNLELVRIASMYNGSNEIGGSTSRMDMERVNFHWTHRWSKTYQQTIFYNTFVPKPPFHVNVTFFKGEVHGLFSRRMVEYVVESDVAQRYLEWCWDTGHPSEHYWNTLNYNTFLQVPGGYQGPLHLADPYSLESIMRAKDWLGLYNERICEGREQRGICVYGVRDAPWLAGRPELFANKFQLTYQYLGLDCLEERHRNRTAARRPAADFNEGLYRSLPAVLYGRKDGLP